MRGFLAFLAALRKLELSHVSATDSEGVKITVISDVANGPQGEWVYSANGIRSPYRLNTQMVNDVNRIDFSYRADRL